MKSKINVIILVDVVGALSAGTLGHGNLCMMDDGDLASTGQGSADLITNCWPGQLVKWSALAVDVQTPVAIKGIQFLGADDKCGDASTDALPLAHDSGETAHDASPELDVWEGIVPGHLVPGTVYRYDLALQMFDGPSSVLRLATPGLLVPA